MLHYHRNINNNNMNKIAFQLFSFFSSGYLIPKIQEDIRVAMSSRWDDFNASRAVDGNENTLANSCKCCAATKGGESWWRLNLGKQYLIKTIIFIGRTDGSKFFFFYTL